MAKTYEQLQLQIEKLQQQAKALQAGEAKAVIERIKTAIAHYGLTAEQLGFKDPTPAPTAAASTSNLLTPPSAKPATKNARKSKGKDKGEAQFSDESGNVWGGRGPRPAWLREALLAGRDINEFRIGKIGQAKKASRLLGAPIAANPRPTGSRSVAATTRRAKVSYGDDAGNSWSGMGPKPGWLKAAIEAGKSIADFAK